MTDASGRQMTYAEVAEDMERAHTAHQIDTLRRAGGLAAQAFVMLRAARSAEDDTLDVLSTDALNLANDIYREAHHLEDSL